MAFKTSIKKYVMDESLSWEERYKKLETHHKEETKWMINKIKNLELDLKDLVNDIEGAHNREHGD